MTRFWTRCAILCMAVCLAITALPGKDIVLCIGLHGHLALEFAQNGRCDEGPCRAVGDTPEPPGVNRNDHASGDCLSCVDIPLSQGPVAGPSSVFDGAKKKSSSATMLDMLPEHPARNVFGGAHFAALSPPDYGGPSCASSRVLRI
jgi:hypothetical protein